MQIRQTGDELIDQIMSREARALMFRLVRDGAHRYVRERDLPKLHVDPSLDRWSIIAALQNRLRAATRSLRKGHWTSDQNRIMALRMALAAECGYYGVQAR